jgi:hypothetical protein
LACGIEVGIQTAVGKVLDATSNGLVVDNVVSADRAAEILLARASVCEIPPEMRA